MRLNVWSWTPVTDHATASSSHSLLGPRCCSGGIFLSSPVILALVAPFPCAGLHCVFLQQVFSLPSGWAPSASAHPWLPLVTHRLGLCYWISPFSRHPGDPHHYRPLFQGSPFHRLPKLPSTLETAELLVKHVSHLHGIPSNTVSD